MVRMLLRYKSWADELVFDSIAALPSEEAYKDRPTTFGNIVQTLSHVRVVDDIFRHHLECRPHGYTSRITPRAPSLTELRQSVRGIDQWYVETFDQWSDEDLGVRVDFEFIGGRMGSMTRGEIALHVVNHATYHRGFVGDMLKQVPFAWPPNDLTVFLRDHFSSAARFSRERHEKTLLRNKEQG